MPQNLLSDETLLDLHFPLAGVDLSNAYSDQAPHQMPNGDWSRSSRMGNNVRSYEGLTQRARGGSRAGLRKYVQSAVVADWIIQDLNTVVSVGGSVMQQSQSGRQVKVVAVSQGNVYYATAGDTVWTLATNNTGSNPPLNFTGVVQSYPNVRKLWFADGTNWCYYDAVTNTVERWVASAGTLPVDSINNTPRLIATWRGRTVLSGLILDPQNWFMSRVGVPTDFDYNPLNVDPTQAIAGNNSPQGLIGDIVTSLCPYSDDILVFFGDHTIYAMSGDPMAGGQIDLVSDTIGGAWGVCWAKDPYGNIYFVSNKMGIYRWAPGRQIERISQQVEQIISSVNTGENVIRMVWDDQFQGMHFFFTPADSPATATHLFYEWRPNAWWPESFANNNHNPVACCIFDGNLPGDRAALLGSWDGYVRSFTPTATTDDGTTITSSVLIGPMLTKDQDDLLCKDMQAILGETSGDVNYAVYVGSTAEAATSNPPVSTGTWSAGRNSLTLIRRSGHAIYVKITSTNAWQMEQIRVRLAGTGKVRRRGP